MWYNLPISAPDCLYVAGEREMAGRIVAHQLFGTLEETVVRRVVFMDIRQRLKQVTPEQIRDDEVLFGEGIGLDSLDAVELVVVVKRHFGVEIKDMTEGREAFASIDSLARFIGERMPA